MRRILIAMLAVGIVAACSGDDAAAPTDDGSSTTEAGRRFCDVYLDYLSDSTAANLTALAASTDDSAVSEYVGIIESEPEVDRLLAATLDLDDLARLRCQPEWVAGAQGAGNTGAAAQALLDAMLAGDRIGARNVASANAIAVFEPWSPIEPDPAAGTPALADVGGQSFSLVLDESTVAQCEVETGVVVACQVSR